MNTPVLATVEIAASELPEVEFGNSADGLPVARVGDLVFAMATGRQNQNFLTSVWRVERPLSDLKHSDFYSHHGTVENEDAFRARVVEQAEHSREVKTFGRQSVRMHCNTPWGPSQGATVYAEGIVRHTTAGHGGFRLSVERNAKIHPLLRADGGWYEEDIAWAIVALTFPTLFTGYERKTADQSIRDCWPDAWEAIHGCDLGPDASVEKDRRAFHAAHAGDWIVISALRSNHHPGMTGVVATLGGKRDGQASQRRYLVPSDEYEVGRFGSVIDEARHPAYDGPSSFVSWRGRAA